MGARRETAVGLVVALAAALFVCLCGLRWGLPGPQRWDALPPALRSDSTALARLDQSWRALYDAIERGHHEGLGEPVTSVRGMEVFAPGWSFPPDHLAGSVRSTLLRTEQPDEQKTFTELARMRPDRLDLKPLFVQYGGSFLYSVGAFLWLSGKAGLVALSSGAERYLADPAAMGRLFLAGRLFVGLFFVLSVLLVFDLGRRCAGPRAAAFAALLYALCPAVVVQAHVLKPHVFAAFWVLASVRLALASAESGRLRDHLLCGACAGLGAGANFFLLAFAALPLAAAWARRGEPGAFRKAAAGAAAAAAVFAAANPYFFLAHGDYLWETTVYPAGSRGAAGLLSQAAFFGRPLGQAAGAGLEALCVVGLWQAWRDARASCALRFCAAVMAGSAAVLAPAVVLLWGFLSGPGAARFFLPLFGLAAVVAASGAAGLRSGPWLKAAVAAAVLAESAARSGVYLRNLSADSGAASTRRLAAEWIGKNIPAGSSIGLARYPDPASTPPFRYDLYRLVVFEDAAMVRKADRPDWIVVDAAGRGALGPLAADYSLSASFQPQWSGLAPLADDSFFANAPMFVYRRNSASLGGVQ